MEKYRFSKGYLLLSALLGLILFVVVYQAPNTKTETPWHQDESYWLDMPDKRAISFWVKPLMLSSVTVQLS